jgi:predicted metalloprotease
LFLALMSLLASQFAAAAAGAAPGVPAAPALASGASGASVVASVDALFKAAQQFWTQQIAALGGRYQPAKLAHVTGPAKGVCGVQGAVVGSFYCPAQQTVFIDDAAIAALSEHAREDATAAAAYVVGHELAHHVQAIIGTTAVVQQARMRSTPEIANRTFATFELQADCYTGLWLRWASGNGIVKLDGLPPVLAAVAMMAPQALAAKSDPTHQILDPLDAGTAPQRLHWAGLGLAGQFNDCDTFGAEAAGKL